MFQLLWLVWFAPALPGFYWAARGLAAALEGGGPAFGPAALALAWGVCLGYALAWRQPRDLSLDEPDALLEPPAQTTKALLPLCWRGELCSSIVSNQS